MSFQTFRAKCFTCGHEWDDAFGVIGTAQIAMPQRECPSCKSRDIGNCNPIHAIPQLTTTSNQAEWTQVLNSYHEMEPCGHTKNFLIGDEHGKLSCTVCTINKLRAAIINEIYACIPCEGTGWMDGDKKPPVKRRCVDCYNMREAAGTIMTAEENAKMERAAMEALKR